jgi:hypothetical protein
MVIILEPFQKMFDHITCFGLYSHHQVLTRCGVEIAILHLLFLLQFHSCAGVLYSDGPLCLCVLNGLHG